MDTEVLDYNQMAELMESILVTGAVGGIGNAVVQQLAKRFEIRAIDIRRMPSGASPDETVHWTCGDVRKIHAIENSLDGIVPKTLRAVVACAAWGPGHSNVMDILETNVDGCVKTIQAARPFLAPGASVVLFGSSAGQRFNPRFVHRRWLKQLESGAPTDTPFSEDLPPEQAYALSKWVLMQWARHTPLWAKTLDVHINCVTPCPTNGLMAEEMRQHAPWLLPKDEDGLELPLADPCLAANKVVSILTTKFPVKTTLFAATARNISFG